MNLHENKKVVRPFIYQFKTLSESEMHYNGRREECKIFTIRSCTGQSKTINDLSAKDSTLLTSLFQEDYPKPIKRM